MQNYAALAGMKSEYPHSAPAALPTQTLPSTQLEKPPRVFDEKQTIEQATSGMSAEEKDQWLTDLSHKVQKDMGDHNLPTDKQKIGRIRFTDEGVTANLGSVSAQPPIPEQDENGIVVRRAQVEGLTVKELEATMAHELTHTQQKIPETFEEAQAVEREADAAAAKTYGGRTYSTALGKQFENLRRIRPVTPEDVEQHKSEEDLKRKYLEAKGTANDNQTVEQVTANMSADEKDKWLTQQVRQVQQDMKNRRTMPSSGPKAIGEVKFGRELDDHTDVDGVNITINDRQSQQLTIKELKSILAGQIAETQQSYPDSDLSKTEAMITAAQTYGGKTYVSATQEMDRRDPGDPVKPLEMQDTHDRLSIRQQKALKYPEPTDQKTIAAPKNVPIRRLN